MTKSLIKAKNNSVSVAINGEVWYVEPKDIKIGDKTLEQVFKENDLKYQRKLTELENHFNDKLEQVKKKLESKIIEAINKSNFTHEQLVKFMQEIEEVG